MKGDKVCNASTDKTTNHWLDSYQIRIGRMREFKLVPNVMGLDFRHATLLLNYLTFPYFYPFPKVLL